MSLNCFFGIEVKPDGVPVIPVIPQGSSLVLTHCSVTSAFPPQQASHDTITKEGSNSTDKKADAITIADESKPLATTYSPVTLYVQGYELPTRFAVCTLAPHKRLPFCPLQLIFTKQASFTLVGHEPEAERAARERLAYPTVHLTGYYEADAQEEEDDEEDDEEDEEGEEDEEYDVSSDDDDDIIRHRPKKQKQQRGNKGKKNSKAAKKARGKSEKKKGQAAGGHAKGAARKQNRK